MRKEVRQVAEAWDLHNFFENGIPSDVQDAMDEIFSKGVIIGHVDSERYGEAIDALGLSSQIQECIDDSIQKIDQILEKN